VFKGHIYKEALRPTISNKQTQEIP
jgi:hypothetical protein